MSCSAVGGRPVGSAFAGSQGQPGVRVRPGTGPGRLGGVGRRDGTDGPADARVEALADEDVDEPARAGDLPWVVPLWAVTGGFAATLVIGTLAGLYPAVRAARLSPTLALAAA